MKQLLIFIGLFIMKIEHTDGQFNSKNATKRMMKNQTTLI
jgi:hypothetical protein